MAANPNQDEEATTLMRTSVQMPGWMWDRLGDIADRTFSSRSQVMRRLLAEALDRDPVQSTEPVKAAV